MGDDVVETARAWLKAQGYPLEYDVARALRRVGYHIEQGKHWIDTDPETGARKAREIDVIGTETGSDIPSDQYPVVRLVVECKHAPHPWIVLMADEQSPGPNVTRALLLQSISGEPPRWKASATPWHFRIPRPYGFSVREAREQKRGSDLRESGIGPYEAVMGVTRAAWDLLLRDSATALTLPVVVTDGALLGLRYDSDGTEHLEKIEVARVVWSGAALERFGTQSQRRFLREAPAIVDVIQRRALDRYARRWRRSTQSILRALKDLGPPNSLR